MEEPRRTQMFEPKTVTVIVAHPFSGAREANTIQAGHGEGSILRGGSEVQSTHGARAGRVRADPRRRRVHTGKGHGPARRRNPAQRRPRGRGTRMYFSCA